MLFPNETLFHKNIKNFITELNINHLDELHNQIFKKYNLQKQEYYLLNLDKHIIIRNDLQLYNALISPNPNNIELQPRLRGGGLFSKIFKKVTGFIFKIFSPLIAPLRGIANAFMMLIKAFIYIGMLAVWVFKFLIWFFTDFILSIPLDIATLIKRLTYLLFDAISSIVVLIAKKLTNGIGNMTISAVSGADNVPDQDTNEENTAQFFKENASKQKCYRTSDGLVPFSVIIATILCPPIGVFMEYGLTGWFNILICVLLTLVFYFPGLIYALILLYC